MTSNQKKKLDDQVAYPQDYRVWSHAKSMAILEGHKYFNLFGGIHLRETMIVGTTLEVNSKRDE